MSEKCPSNSWKHGERLCCCFLPYNHLRKHLPFFQLLSCQNRVPNPPAALCSCLLNICQWANYYFSPSTYLEPVKGHIYKKKILSYLLSLSTSFLTWNTKGDVSQNVNAALFHMLTVNGKGRCSTQKAQYNTTFPMVALHEKQSSDQV